MKKNSPALYRAYDRSVVALVGGLALTICSVELAIMVVLGHIQLELSPLSEGVLDCIVLTTIATPIIFFTTVKPFVQSGRSVQNDLERELKAKGATLARLDLQKRVLDLHAIVSETDIHGNITYVNDAFCKISQYSREELIGNNHRIVTASYHPDEFWRDMYATLQRGEVWRGEVCSRSKDGSLYWAQTTNTPAKDENGEIVGYVSARTNITEAKEREGRLQHTQILLRHAMAKAEAASLAKSEFLAMMSHEIRTPMNGFIGMLELLKEEKLSTVQRDLVGTAHDCADALLVVINDILDYSKMEAGKVALERISFSPIQIVDNVKSMFSARAQAKGLTLDIEIAPDMPPWIIGDPTRVRQILINLVGNAIKFTTSGSVRVVGVHHTKPDASLKLLFEVRDTGIGVPLEARSKLFDRFSQADGSTTRRFGGTGLGLAICKQLVEMMHGEIGVESQVGKGSRFWFTIGAEIGSEPIEHEPNSADIHISVLPRKLKILVAEDNYVNQKFIRGLLGRGGHVVHVVNDGAEAVEALKEALYDVVLMDVQMPKMDGPSATRLIRQLDGPNATIPIIALTANAMSGQREEYLAAGMDDYVTKPVNPGTLFASLGRFSHRTASPKENVVKPAEVAVGAETDPTSAEPVVPVDTALTAQSLDFVQSHPILDAGRLKELSQYLDLDSLRDALDTVPQEARDCLDSIKNAIAEGNVSATRRAAHKLRGMASNFGAKRLFEIANTLETNSSLTLDDFRRMLPILETTIHETQSQLERAA
jgi:PAS domain S-box-containing protein